MSNPQLTVAVIGLGSVGSMAAWQLSKRENVRVIGLEQYGRVHSRGSYAGESRVFRTAYHEGGLYVPMLLESRNLWRELEKESGRDVYYEVGTLSIAEEMHPEYQTTLGTVRDYDLPHELFDADQLRARFPQHRIHENDAGILDLQGGGLRPEVSVMAALEIAERNGADLRFNTPVLGIEEYKDGVVIRTEQEALKVDRIVIASGSWSNRISPELNDLLRLQILGLTWFMPRTSIEPFVPANFPAFLRDSGPVHVFGAPSFDGYSLKACSNPTWDVVRDVDDVPVGYTREELVRIGQQMQELIPDINPEPVRSSVHHCAYTPNRLPVVDLSESERVITVAGLSGHGFKFIPALGKFAAELAADSNTESVPGEFSLESHMAVLRDRGHYQGGGH
ncbi:N-methyl-L-tryptophan oxidase [Gulosibacter molinativorax]|uniref:N-methyl-L-tryptophan oxidase n=1 Tax=Gulosibacter molinativorax TaxID=256821 RepID=A0ABT7C9V5_9MICO|nr:N-methyl-L-tryptophan oxidase [Gulosibacter molinativorax]MDJ1371993.1 N-methyl-L-tryptophan oxidase [Gulosibacter molinativorax]QUY62641.1 Sarcosine oxidase, alpha subunit SoxA [Gulosibacter molinativorax]